MAARTMTETHYPLGNIRKIVLDCVCDSTNGSFAADELTTKFEGRLLDLETNPGSTAPTDNYDIVLDDAGGHDVLEGVGANRHTTTTQKAAIVYSGTGTHPTVDETDTLSLVITNNSVNSAIIQITLYYALGG
tara:strand:+ start:974 stop:1372 length:399 start_codon:yes stop_codon:yes gene_type:complete